MSITTVSPYSVNDISLLEILTQYVNSSHKNYKSMQHLLHTRGEESPSAAIRECSVNFRQCVNEFLQMLSAFAEELDHQGAAGVEIVDGAIDVVLDAQKLWHLTEFFVLSPSQSVCSDTISWIQGMIEDSDCIPFKALLDYYRSCPEPELSDLNNNSNGPYRDGFWGVVFDLTLRGNLGMAWDILSTHSEIHAMPQRSHELLELRQIFMSHPFCAPSDDNNRDDTNHSMLNGVGAFMGGSSAREKSALWMEWHQMVQEYRAKRSSLATRLSEMDVLLRLLLGEERTIAALTAESFASSSPNGDVSWGSSRANWKTVALCLLLFSKPALSRAEVARCVEQAMKMARAGGQDTDSLHEGIVTRLLHGDVGPLLKSLYERSHFSSDDSTTSGAPAVASAVMLLVCTHLTQLLQLAGVLDSSDKTGRKANQPASSVQRDFVESIATEAVLQLAELNFPMEILETYISRACPGSASSCVKLLLAKHPVQCDGDALTLSTSFARLRLFKEAGTVLVERGLHWLRKSTRPERLPALDPGGTRSDQMLYRLGGMEAKALTFFLRAYDSARCRALLDISLRRCIVATCHYNLLMPTLRVKYSDIAQLIPADTVSAAEAKARSNAVSGDAGFVPANVESMIALGILGAIDSVADMHLCHAEAFALRHYCQALQSLTKAHSVEFGDDAYSMSCDSLRKMLQRLAAVRIAADNLKELVSPIDADDGGRSRVCASSAAYGCPQRYWLHVVDLIISVNQLYSSGRVEGERIATVLSERKLSDQEAEELTELLQELQGNPQVLFSRTCIQRIMTLMQMLKLSYVQNKANVFGDLTKLELQEIHFRLLQMSESAMCFENFKTSEGAGDYRNAQTSKFLASMSGPEKETQKAVVRSSLTLQISDNVFHNTSGMQVSPLDAFLTAPQSSLSLRLHS